MSFVGDAVIADWPLRDRKHNCRALEAAFRVMDVLDARAQQYRSRFGVAPWMRAVLHGGDVIAGEAGDSRRQIVYLGDVLNVASRIEGVAKQAGIRIAISAHMLSLTELPAGVTARAAGRFHLKGVREEMEIFELVRDDGGPVSPNDGFASQSGAAN